MQNVLKVFVFGLFFFGSIGTVFAQGAGSVDVQILTRESNPVTIEPFIVLINFSEPVTGFDESDIEITHLNLSSSEIIKTLTLISSESWELKISFPTSVTTGSKFGKMTIKVLEKTVTSSYLQKYNTESNELEIDYQPNCDNENMKESRLCIQFSESIGQNKVIRADTGLDLFGNYMVMMYQYAASIIGVVAVLVMVAGGVMIITAGANSESVNMAKGLISKALISLVLLFLMGLILKTVNPAFYTTHECEDGIDNDEDQSVDHMDKGCDGYIPGSADFSFYEGKASNYECADGIDNDGDGRVDADDPGCIYPVGRVNPNHTQEARCQAETDEWLIYLDEEKMAVAEYVNCQAVKQSCFAELAEVNKAQVAVSKRYAELEKCQNIY